MSWPWRGTYHRWLFDPETFRSGALLRADDDDAGEPRRAWRSAPRVIAYTADEPHGTAPWEIGDALFEACINAGGSTGDGSDWSHRWD